MLRRFGLIGSIFWLLMAALAAQTPTSLYFPVLATAQDRLLTGFAIVNLSPRDTAHLTFTIFDSGGGLVAGPNITNPALRALAPGAQLPILDTPLFGFGLLNVQSAAWVRVDSDIASITGFFLLLDPSVTVLDGANAQTEATSLFVLPEIEVGGGTTTLRLANPAPAAAAVLFELIASSGALVTTAVSRFLSGRGLAAESLAELFPGIPIQNTDYLRIRATRPVIPYELLSRADSHVQGLNGQAMAGGSTILYCPQYVVGGTEYRSTLTIINLDSTPGSIALEFFRDDGALMASRNTDIAANGKLQIADQRYFVNAANTPTEGYLKISSSGPRLTGSIVFGDLEGSRFSTALPLVSTLISSAVVGHLASDSTYFTGLSILNPQSVNVSTNIEAYDERGVIIQSARDNIGAGQRRSQLVSQLFPNLSDRTSGYLKVTADKGIAGFALFGTKDLSALAAIPMQPLLTTVTTTPTTSMIVSTTTTSLITTTSSTSSTSTTTSTIPPQKTARGALDSPQNGDTVSGTIIGNGWAVILNGKTGVIPSTVRVLIDDAPAAQVQITMNVARPDVRQALAAEGLTVPNDVGYRFSWNSGTVADGSHALRIQASDFAGVVPEAFYDIVRITIRVTTPQLPFRGSLESPVNGQSVFCTVAGSGWAFLLDGTTATLPSRVEIRVDGSLVSNSTLGISRPDVPHAFPGISVPGNTGFRFTWDSSSVASGSHTLTVMAFNASGTGFEIGSITINVTPCNVNLEGNWSLSGGDLSAMSFKVVNNTIKELKYAGDYYACGFLASFSRVTFPAWAGIPIRDRRFEETSVTGDQTTVFAGTFESGSRASGTLKITNPGSNCPGVTLHYSWAATK